MKLKTYLFKDNCWSEAFDSSLDSENTLIIIFGSSNIANLENEINKIILKYKKSKIIGAYTSDAIYNNEIYSNAISVSVTKFEKSYIKLYSESLCSENNSYLTAKRLANNLLSQDLKSIFLLCDSLNTDGSMLAEGLNEILPDSCIITGGLIGNTIEANISWMIINGEITSKQICGIGFYGNDLKIENSYECGWKRFGIDRKITSIKNNILYTLDNKPALELYKRYLGEFASELPGSALNFPLIILNNNNDDDDTKIRAIIDINDKDQSITLSGSIEENTMVSFAKANLDELIDSAQDAGEKLSAKINNTNNDPSLCITVSCIARKIILKQNIEDELDVIQDALSKNTSIIGFYSYGEISNNTKGCCDFYNQTIALLTIYES